MVDVGSGAGGSMGIEINATVYYPLQSVTPISINNKEFVVVRVEDIYGVFVASS